MEVYQPLPLKYRPLVFADVIGQKVVKRVLVGMLKANRIGVAYLFGGPRGTGKTTCARIFAKALNCLQKNGYEPCCRCKICEDIARSRSADVIEVDSASSGSVAAIRSIRESSHFRTLGGGYRVWILDEVHSTSREGFNALLKIMEEPPPKVVFVLCTTEVTKVPETIISRCFQLPFRAITTEDIVERLKYVVKQEEVKVTDEMLWAISRRGAGSIRDSLTLMDQLMAVYGRDLTKTEALETVGLHFNQLIGGLLIKVFDFDVKNGLEEFRQVWRVLPDSREFVRGMMLHFRNVEYLNHGLDEYVDSYDKKVARKLQIQMDESRMKALLNSISVLEKALQYTRLSPQILIEMWILSLLPRKKIEKIVDPLLVDRFWDSF